MGKSATRPAKCYYMMYVIEFMILALCNFIYLFIGSLVICIEGVLVNFDLLCDNNNGK